MNFQTTHSSLVQQPIRWMGCFCLFFLCGFSAHAQLQIAPHLFSEDQIASQKTIAFSTLDALKGEDIPIEKTLRFNIDGIWLPKYARENPAGHAPLCRIETGLENRMTVPIWIKAGEIQNISQFGTGNLYVRMKLLRF